MVTFSCENCGDVFAKKKVDAHSWQCRPATFSCLDCGSNFQGGSWKNHTSCISEAQKYQGPLYKENKKSRKTDQSESMAMVPRNAYVEDVPDAESGALAVVDVPPRAPTPPPAPVNVFDFLVSDDAGARDPRDVAKALPSPNDSKLTGREGENDAWYDVEEIPTDDRMQYEQPDYRHYLNAGPSYGYGYEPVVPNLDRYDSYDNLHGDGRRKDVYYTPAPRNVSARGHGHKESADSTSKKSGKRKREHLEAIDVSATKSLQPTFGPKGDVVMTDVPPALHSGLTGGLSKLMSARNSSGFPFPPSPDVSGEGEGVGDSPLSPLKKQKQVELETRESGRERGRDKKARPVMKRKAPSSHVRIGFSSQSVRRDRDPRSPTRNYDRDRERDRDGSDERRRRRRRRRSNSPADNHHDHHDHHDHHGRRMKAIEYKPRPSSPAANDSNAIVRRDPGTVALPRTAQVSAHARAELFMSFVTKGPESGRGCSINKALKRYHRERFGDRDDDDDDEMRRDGGAGGGERRKRKREERERKAEEKVEEEKELWKSLRLKRNDRGEIVLFFGEGMA